MRVVFDRTAASRTHVRAIYNSSALLQFCFASISPCFTLFLASLPVIHRCRDHLIVQQGTTCYVYARGPCQLCILYTGLHSVRQLTNNPCAIVEGVVPPSMLKSTTGGVHRTSPRPSPCKAKTGCMRMTCDEQIAKNPELTCSRLEQSYCDCSGCLWCVWSLFTGEAAMC